MKYLKLGKSDLTVSRICLGCMGFGNAATGQHRWTVDESQTREIIKHALELGINFYDTAIVYQNGITRPSGKVVWRCANRVEHRKKLHKYSPSVPEGRIKELIGEKLDMGTFDENGIKDKVDFILIHSDGHLESSCSVIKM